MNEKTQVFNMNYNKNEHAWMQDENSRTKQEEALKRLLEDSVKEWCENTTSHGFSNIVKTDSWIIRTIWIFLVIASMAYCFYSIITFIFLFLEYGVNVNYQSITEATSDFPAVSICNLNSIDLTAQNTTGTYIFKLLQANNISPQINGSNDDGYYLVSQAASLLKAQIIADSNLTKDAREKIGYTMETMLISCYFNDIQCNSSDFEYFHTFEYGNCYRFNGKNSIQKTTSKSGPSSGLSLELFTGISGQSDYYLIKRGAHVVVHNRSSFPLVKSQGIDVQTGSATNIGVSRTFYVNLASPFSECRDNLDILPSDSIYYQLTANLSAYYQRLCYEIYIQIKAIEPKCNCSDPSILLPNSSYPICKNKTQLTCVNDQKNLFNQTISNDDCPKECQSILYSTTINSATYPTSYYAGILQQSSNVISKFNPANTFNITSLLASQAKPNRKKRDLFDERPFRRFKRAVNNTNTNVTNTNSTSSNQTTSNSSNTNVTNTNSTNSNQTTSNPANSSNQMLMGPGKNPPSNSDLSSAFVKISVYYDDLRYTYIQDTPAITSDTLIGVIGGQFGLFMGASFLSFAEVAEMFVNLIRVILKYKKKKRKIQTKIAW